MDASPKIDDCLLQKIDTWRSAQLASVPLLLATPNLLRRGLDRIGLRWVPVTHTDSNAVEALDNRPGLYMWVDNLAETADLADNGVLYIGIGAGRDGVVGRVRYELGGREDGVHAHGLMLKRRNAHALIGEITDAGLDDDWMDWLVANERLNSIAPQRIRQWRTNTDIVKSAERFAVRLSIHLGDTVAPVNSQFAGAWADDSGADWAAFAAAQWIALTDLNQNG